MGSFKVFFFFIFRSEIRTFYSDWKNTLSACNQECIGITVEYKKNQSINVKQLTDTRHWQICVDEWPNVNVYSGINWKILKIQSHAIKISHKTATWIYFIPLLQLLYVHFYVLVCVWPTLSSSYTERQMK